jgi:alpha-1,2-mannosyltransferase
VLSASASPSPPDLRVRTRQLVSAWAFLPILAIAAPLQTQFEHQNLNIVLLALAAFGVDALARGRDAAAGAALGLASAIKVYPVLALVWLAARRRWRAFGVGIAVAALASMAPIVIRGADRFAADLADWRAIVGGGWPTRRANQSIVAMWGRYLLGEGPDGYPNVTTDQTGVLILAALTALVIIIPLVVVLWRAKDTRLRLAQEIACVNAVAVLVSPIAWEHYWVAFFPPLLALGRGRRARITFWIALVCFTVLSRPIVGAYGARLVRALSLMTWAGVLTCLTLATQIVQRDDGDGRGA